MLALNKTKAALQGRLSHLTKNTEEHITAISLVNLSRNPCLPNYGKSPQGVTAAMARLLSEGVRHWLIPLIANLEAEGVLQRSAVTSPNFSGDLQSAENTVDFWLAEKPANSKRWLRFGLQISTKGISSLEQNQPLRVDTCGDLEFRYQPNNPMIYIDKNSKVERWRLKSIIYLLSAHISVFYENFVGHPLGSIPCRTSSARANAFSQLPRLTPSRLAASFNCWRNSGVMRIWKVGDRPSPLGVLSLLIVDMYVRNLIVWILLCTYAITSYLQKATPRTVRAVPRRLTKPLVEVTVMAGSQHTQTHPKFTWRFLALDASTRSVIHIDATTEREARDQSPIGCVMVFAGRLPIWEAHHA